MSKKNEIIDFKKDIKDKIEKDELIIFKCKDETFFFNKLKDNKISFHVGYTSFTMKHNEVEKLIIILNELNKF